MTNRNRNTSVQAVRSHSRAHTIAIEGLCIMDFVIFLDQAASFKLRKILTASSEALRVL